MAQVNRGGSILVFGVVALLLGGLLLGGIYWTKQTTSTTVQPSPPPQKPSEKPSENKPGSSKKEPVVPSPQPPAPHNNPQAKELPVTGPTETLLTLIVLGSLSAGAVGYWRSRRPAVSL